MGTYPALLVGSLGSNLKRETIQINRTRWNALVALGCRSTDSRRCCQPHGGDNDGRRGQHYWRLHPGRGGAAAAPLEHAGGSRGSGAILGKWAGRQDASGARVLNVKHLPNMATAAFVCKLPRAMMCSDSFNPSPGGDPGGELTGTYVQEGVLRWGCGGAEPPRSRPAQRKKMGSIGCLKRFSTED